MENKINAKRSEGGKKHMKKVLPAVALVLLVCCAPALAGRAEKLAALEQRITSFTLNQEYKDDGYALAVVKGALESIREGSGGIGACLVDTSTGEIVEYGRNRQFSPHFRSDFHAEMDLLNKYEDRVKKMKRPDNYNNLRECKNLVLVTSLEPCPMCLTRIINAGIKTVLYVVEDREGGMATRLDSLPPFWREFAADREFRLADCSVELRQIAMDLFHFSSRSFAKNRVKNK
jgi:cytosine deaminase